MFGLTLSAVEYPVMKCCFTAPSRACPALDARNAPGTAAGTKESVCPPFRSGRISTSQHFLLEGQVFPP